ncbi:MAG: hypothetical protein AB7E60_04730 [Sphingobium sp.]
MQEPLFYLIMAAAGLATTGILAAAVLRGWDGWLDLKRAELAGRRGEEQPAATRIELAALKERIRKLEAIAAGVDL